MNSIKRITMSLLTLSLMSPLLVSQRVFANDSKESTSDKIQDEASDATTSVKKAYRHAKQKGRKAIGTDTALKDAGDKVGDMTDDASNGIKKAKRHIEHSNQQSDKTEKE